ncbi:MAG: aminomethyl-transferring glycine dehydrogenase subunit GcvPB [Planctomycetota bacterium]
MHPDDRLLFEKSRPGMNAIEAPRPELPKGAESLDTASLLPAELRRQSATDLPAVGQLDLVRHYTRLSRKNFAISTTFYPLGSCTMKFNPLINETVVAEPGFADLHPYQNEDDIQGALGLVFELERYLAEISGLPHISLHPAAGAHGELTALMVIREHFRKIGEDDRRTVLIPDSAHGTNPASCTLCGFKTVELKSNEDGLVDIDDLKKKIEAAGPKGIAALMITNPNTLGLFERRIQEIAELIHSAGGKVYMDGANLNALMGISRPGDFGVDIMHFNLHKTFSTPHGTGGPGAGPIGVTDELEPYLPIPRVVKDGERFRFEENRPSSIGRTRAFVGNFGVMVRAYTYIRALGRAGIRRVGENAVLNANYLRVLLGKHMAVAHPRLCMHEFVLTARRLAKEHGVKATDLAKRLLDSGFHPPTIYFPLIVPEALMIEPTETESKSTLDAFAQAFGQIIEEAQKNPEKLHQAPTTTPVQRMDEVRAVKQPVLRWRRG